MSRTRILAGVALAFLALATAQAANPLTQGTAKWSETQILTRAAPSTSSTDGIPLKGVVAWRLIVCAPAAQAITGGSMLVWIQANDGLWGDTPNLAAILVFKSTGQRCQSFGEFPVLVRTGYMLPATSSVTLSGAGTTVTVRLEYTIL